MLSTVCLEQELTDASRVPTLADCFISKLRELGIEYVFGVPGGAIEPLFDALARQERNPGSLDDAIHYISRRRNSRRTKSLHTVVARHEAGAAFMADGYARETGRLAVACATTGPGASNLITGVASAYADNIPMLVITAQTALPNFGRHALQESSSDAVDTVAMFAHCTKYSSLISHPDQMAQKLVTAMTRAYQKPRGPVHLSFPIDIFGMPAPGYTHTATIAPLLREPHILDSQAMTFLQQCLHPTVRIALFIGGDCGDAIDEIIRFAETMRAPLVTTPMGKRWVSAYHPLNYGVFGFAGHSSARDILQSESIDYIIAVGTSLGELATSGWDEKALLNQKLIHIDSIPEHFVHSSMACLHVYGNIRLVFSALNRNKYRPQVDSKRASELDNLLLQTKERLKKLPKLQHIQLQEQKLCKPEEAPIKPQCLMQGIAEFFPQNTRIVCDAGNSWAWATHYLHLQKPQRYRIGMGYGAMAWAVGASVGTALGCDGQPTVCLTGDGSYLMSGQEITVAVQMGLAVCFIVLNDQSLGMVKHGQRLGGGEPIGFQLPPVDFCAMAESVGAKGFRIQTLKQLYSLDIDRLFSSGIPFLLDVYIDPEEIPPMGARMKVLKANNDVFEEGGLDCER